MAVIVSQETLWNWFCDGLVKGWACVLHVFRELRSHWGLVLVTHLDLAIFIIIVLLLFVIYQQMRREPYDQFHVSLVPPAEDDGDELGIAHGVRRGSSWFDCCCSRRRMDQIKREYKTRAKKFINQHLD